MIVDDNGTEWTEDLIGNSGYQYDGYDDTHDLPVMSLQDYVWWHDYIDMYEAVHDKARSLLDEYQDKEKEILEALDECFESSDYNDHGMGPLLDLEAELK